MTKLEEERTQLINLLRESHKAPYLDYGEKLINGVLHWRETLDGEWKPLSPEKLTDLVIQLRKALQVATACGQFHSERLTIPWPSQPVVTKI